MVKAVWCKLIWHGLRSFFWIFVCLETMASKNFQEKHVVMTAITIIAVNNTSRDATGMHNNIIRYVRSIVGKRRMCNILNHLWYQRRSTTNLTKNCFSKEVPPNMEELHSILVSLYVTLDPTFTFTFTTRPTSDTRTSRYPTFYVNTSDIQKR